MLTVVQVLGKGRSGSTLVDALAGQLPGVHSCGELWRLPRTVAEGRSCTCGLAYTECEVWGRVIEGLSTKGVSLERLETAQKRTMSWSSAPGLLVGARRSGLSEIQLERLEVADLLYATISRATGSDVLVDSSKWPFDPLLLHHSNDFDLRVIHLVRDPRAVAYSWTRAKLFKDGSGRPMDRHSSIHSSLSWMARNLSVEWSRKLSSVPTKLLRYEDLVADPRGTMSALASFLGKASSHLDWLSDHSATLSALHLVAGNPDRPVDGKLEIGNDDVWRTSLPARQRRTVAAIAGPLMRRYGYR